MALTIKLDGVMLAEGEYEAKSVKKVISKNKKQYNNGIVFMGNAFEKIYQKFVTNKSGYVETMKVEIIDGCCGNKNLTFYGEIRGDSFNYTHGECKIECTVYENSNRSKALDVIRTTTIEEMELLHTTKHPMVRYCKEIRPVFIQYLVIIFGSLLMVCLYVLDGLTAVIRAIYGVVKDLLSGNTFSIRDELLLFNKFRTKLKEYMFPCDKAYPSPYISTMLQAIAQEANIEVKSSIFEEPAGIFKDVVYTSAQSSGGTSNLSYTGIIKGNMPIKTIEDFLNSFASMGIEWTLHKIGTKEVLFLERTDYFDASTKIDIPSNATLRIQPLQTAPPAYFSIEYSQDATDNVGNEAWFERYTSIIELNDPFSDVQRGKKTFSIPYAPLRHIDDGLKPESSYENLTEFISNIDIFGVNINPFKGFMLCGNDILFIPKFIDIDRNTGKIKNNNRILYAQSIYDNFLYLQNPRLNQYERYSCSISFTMDCDFAEKINKNDNFWIKTPYGYIKSPEISVDLQKRRIDIAGNIHL